MVALKSVSLVWQPKLPSLCVSRADDPGKRLLSKEVRRVEMGHRRSGGDGWPSAALVGRSPGCAPTTLPPRTLLQPFLLQCQMYDWVHLCHGLASAGDSRRDTQTTDTPHIRDRGNKRASSLPHFSSSFLPQLLALWTQLQPQM